MNLLAVEFRGRTWRLKPLILPAGYVVAESVAGSLAGLLLLLALLRSFRSSLTRMLLEVLLRAGAAAELRLFPVLAVELVGFVP